jgi:hypothetical protein
MATQQILYGLGNSLTNKKFKFVLSTKEQSLTLRYAPQGWKSSEITFIRDPQYKGVIESYSTNELTFVKDGRDFIQSYYEKGGVDYEVNISIYILNNSTFKYQIYYSGKLDLSTYKIDSTGVTCKVIASGFQDLVLNRDSIDVDMMSTKYIGGGENSMEYLNNVWQRVTIPAYSATQNADWSISGFKDPTPNPYNHYVPMDLTVSEFEGTESQEFDETTPFLEAQETLTFDITGKVIVELVSLGADTKFTHNLYLKKNGSSIAGWTNQNPGVVQTVIFEIDINQPGISVIAGDKLTLEASVSVLPNVNFMTFYNLSSFSISKDLADTIPQVNAPMFYIYEAFVRTIQLISGNSQPFYSEFLGRTDSVPESYASDGAGSLMTLTNGLWIRGFDSNINGLNFNLRDLFKTVNAIYNIGLGFETIGGNQKVRVEDEKYFFDVEENPDFAIDGIYWKTNQILDLSDGLSNEIISKEVLPDWYANQISGGYGSFEYENIQGLKEFNTSSSWAVPVKSINRTHDIKSPYRADTQGVNKLRTKPIETNPTEDVSGDNDIFVFDVKRGGGYVFTVKTDEDFDNVSGGVDPDQCYNLNFTPRRNLERHGNWFYSMLDSRVTLDTNTFPSAARPTIGKELQWLKSDKNTALITSKPGEATKVENDDIVIGDLTRGYWIPEAYIFEAKVDEDTISAIQANPRGVIKIAKDKYGWILEVQSNNETGKGEFKLLRCDLGHVKIIV